MLNPIGPELVRRVRRAINDETPFHVYLVLPVHPEGTLDTLNIMVQVHLTMHALVHGENSLVNGIRRAILASRYRKERKVSAERAAGDGPPDSRFTVPRLADCGCLILNGSNT